MAAQQTIPRIMQATWGVAVSMDYALRSGAAAAKAKPSAAAHRLLHRLPDKEHLYRSSLPLWWSEDLRSWMSFDPAVIIAILKSKDFQVVDYEGETMKIVDGLGLDLHTTARIAHHLPLAQEGCPHAALRRQMAVELGEKPARALLAFGATVQREVARAFGTPGEFDIVARLFAPLVDDLVAALTGIRVAQDLTGPSPSQLFDKHLSLNRRKIIDGKLRDIRSRAGGPEPSSDADTRVALLVLGSDAMLGSLGESFLRTVRAHPGRLLSEMSWSQRLPATGVPYLDRIATGPAEVCGHQIKGGDRVRVYLDALRCAPAEFLDAYFGAGRHACLGRPFAQKAWHAVALGLGAVAKRVTVGAVAYRPSDHVFNCPTSIMVTIE